MIEKMKNKLLALENQFDRIFSEHFDSMKGHGGAPIVDNSKGRSQRKARDRANERLHILRCKVELQKEKIAKAEYRHCIKNTQTKKSARFIHENPIHVGLFYLEKKNLVKQWPRNPEYFFISGKKIVLKTFEGRVGVAARFPAKNEEDFRMAKELAIIANNFNQSHSNSD